MQNIRLQYDTHENIPTIKKGSNKLNGSATENLRQLLILPFA